MPGEKDLFDESSMSFGEHLETLRTHLIRIIIGVFICVMISLTFSNDIIKIMSSPIKAALEQQGKNQIDDIPEVDFWTDTWNALKDAFSGAPVTDPKEEDLDDEAIRVKVSPRTIAQTLHDAFPEQYSAPPEKVDSEKIDTVEWVFTAKEFRQWNHLVEQSNKPKTFNVHEAFLTYLKVAIVAGLVLSSPWIFYQLWLFVAAGLYPHERNYVYFYMPVSIGLFLTGAFFCFRWVLPLVITFLLSFNDNTDTVAAIRLSEYISFAIMLPVMFGLSFQLPLIMLLLERINIIDVKTYREKRRMAILIISIVSMFMTPQDPGSMLMMMIPLCLLYELGIWMCKIAGPKTNPFDDIATT